MSSVLFFAVLIILFAAVVTFFKKLARNKILKNRIPENIEAIYEKYGMNVYIDYGEYTNVLAALQKSFDIDAALIRPCDRLKDLYDMDSWRLGEGLESFCEEISNSYGICVFDFESETVGELMKYIGRVEKMEIFG